MEHISHDRSEGWLRNVHAGHAMELCLTSLGEVAVKEVAVKEAEEDKADDGSDDERCWDDAEVVGIGSAVRSTPHKSQIRAAAGLRPGGLR